MANTQGGSIVYGVHDVQEEADHIEPVPLSDRERQRHSIVGPDFVVGLRDQDAVTTDLAPFDYLVGHKRVQVGTVDDHV